MLEHVKKAYIVALAIGLGTPAGVASADDRMKIDSVTPDLSLGRTPGNVMIPGDSFIPGDTFFPGGAAGPMSPALIRSFASQGITTAGDLVSADPRLVGRILEIDPREAQRIQRNLRGAMSKR